MLVDVIEGQRRHLEVCVSGRDHCRAGRDLMVLWTHGVSGGPQADDLLGGSLSGSKTKDQSPSLLLQSEAPSCSYGLWSPSASEGSRLGGPEIGSGGLGGDPSDEDWRSKRKHVFVLSEAGKPIYSRYGSVEALSTTMGVMTALVSFVQSAGDAIRAIYAGEQRGRKQSRRQ